MKKWSFYFAIIILSINVSDLKAQPDSIFIRLNQNFDLITKWEQLEEFSFSIYNCSSEKLRIPKNELLGSVFQNGVDFGVEIQKIDSGKVVYVDSCITLWGPSLDMKEREFVTLRKGEIYTRKFDFKFCMNEIGLYRIRVNYFSQKLNANGKVIIGDWKYYFLTFNKGIKSLSSPM